jgi:hypothetical protein
MVLLLSVLLVACQKAPPAQSESPHVHEPTSKAGAPVVLSADIGPDEAVITAVFEGPGTGVQLTAWGATGLQLEGERLRWSGSVREGQEVTVTVRHSGAGDLAVRVDGTFADESIDAVRSFTVGDRALTPVPTNGKTKGWDATRR